ncbi:MAG: EscU/YscU/HrcU family type III secretion system export apparatus switch protein [Oligoflexia bacterium]|nr:EscU/YscU/HrcU family type III secretion system export apparatus switch protein [Oligoflexia bacterium]
MSSDRPNQSEIEPEARKREHAVALQYAELDELPRIVATGAGEIARQILALAKEHEIPIQEDATLTEMLSNLSVGAHISPNTYKLVAEIISFLYHTDCEFQKAHPELTPVMSKQVK